MKCFKQINTGTTRAVYPPDVGELSNTINMLLNDPPRTWYAYLAHGMVCSYPCTLETPWVLSVDHRVDYLSETLWAVPNSMQDHLFDMFCVFMVTSRNCL